MIVMMIIMAMISVALIAVFDDGDLTYGRKKLLTQRRMATKVIDRMTCFSDAPTTFLVVIATGKQLFERRKDVLFDNGHWEK